MAIAGDYLTLLRDVRFNRPALAVSLSIGALYTIFAASPALLSCVLGFGPTGLGSLATELAISNGFGFGGDNASLLLRRA